MIYLNNKTMEPHRGNEPELGNTMRALGDTLTMIAADGDELKRCLLITGLPDATPGNSGNALLGTQHANDALQYFPPPWCGLIAANWV